MGFDIECIIDIQNYPGEYFCPVCRTLVYPNEALQSQCTHVFCKPCLSHVANSTRACPYDGYLVTEADSKPLIQSDKAYAETIGKVKVRCLYHRSGCTWEGSLAECTSHCLGCSFGNSPVICNRCGVQIVHSQVHEHAQSCPGAYQVQQAPDGAQGVPSSGVTAATGAVNLNQANSQAGVPTSEAQKSLSASLLPGQDLNQKPDGNPQASGTVTAAVSTAEQLYQQQYQQYYQQYPGYGYDAYQQAYQQYYPYQQVAVQQYQQQPQQIPGQPNVPFGQTSTQVQGQSSSQTQVQSQAQTQHPTQPHVQSQSSVQFPAIQPQTKTQTQIQPHGAAAINSQMQPPVPLSLNQPPVNRQQQPHSVMQSHGQLSAHTPHGIPPALSQQHNSIPMQPQPQPQAQTQPQPQLQPQPQPQPLPHPQPQPHLQGQPQPQSYLQPQLPTPSAPLHPPQQHVPAQYPQPHLTVNNSQPSHFHLQPQMLTSQPHLQQQMQPQLHPQPILRPSQASQPTAPGSQSNQPTALGGQPNQPGVHGTQPNQPGVHGIQPNHHAALGLQPQPVQASGHAVSGYQPYQQPQPPQQHPLSSHPAAGSFPSNQMQAQALAQPPLMRPSSQGAVPNQTLGLFPQGQVTSMPPAQQQQFHHQNQPLSYQQRAVVHSNQHSIPQYVQPLSSSVQSSLQTQSTPQQSQLHSQGPLHMVPQNSNVQLQPNVSVAPGVQLQQTQSYVGRPLMPNQGFPVQPQPAVQSSGGFVTGAQMRPAQIGPYEHSTNHSYSSNSQNQMQTAPGQQVPQSVTTHALSQGGNVSERGVMSGTGSSQIASESVAEGVIVDSLELRPLTPEVGLVSEQETIRQSTDKFINSQPLTRQTNELHGRKDPSFQPTGQLSLKEEHKGYSFENSPDVGKQRQISNDARLEDLQSNKSQKIFPKPGNEILQSATGLVNQQKSAGLPTPPPGPSPHSQVPGSEATARPQGSRVSSLPSQPINSREQSQQVPLQKQTHDAVLSGISVSTTSFAGGPAPFGASLGTSALSAGSGDPQGGMKGRPPRNLDGDYGKLSGERAFFGHPSTMEPNALRMNGGSGFDRSGYQDERFRALPVEQSKSFTKDPIWPLDQGSKSFDRGLPHGLNYDARPVKDSAGGGPNSRFQSAFHPSGPGISKHDVEHLPPRNPDKDYFGRKAPSFGEGSRLNLPGDPQVNPFHENGFISMPGFPRRGEHYGPDGLGFVENRVPDLHDHIRRGDRFRQEIPPSHFRRGDHAPMGEGAGPGNHPPNHHYGEPYTGNKPGLPRLGEPGFRSSFSSQGFPNDGPYPVSVFILFSSLHG
ncbi:OLC1v1006146C5 [Oldenlandia corymbosa var. corymbosa]|uniref:OLC1v1006146C5 n=1 Tax=Oldenlandia corymbosa var. corymbosa TaxID=529605 RepID=A0AAV1DIS1_OLDCO|nr:OLC1v1006146C5 [Oldenlandia corymbosa var. corymbosa]